MTTQRRMEQQLVNHTSFFAPQKGIITHFFCYANIKILSDFSPYFSKFSNISLYCDKNVIDRYLEWCYDVKNTNKTFY